MKRLVHYCSQNYQSGGMGGVPRFDDELKKVFPDIISVAKNQHGSFLNWFARHSTTDLKDLIVITDNGMCLDIPEDALCLAVHHGMARTHKERNPEWPGEHFIIQQDKMINRGNTLFVACSTFTANEFHKHYGQESDYKILHAVDTKPYFSEAIDSRVIVDARSPDKGSEAVKEMRRLIPNYSFVDLKCGKYDKEKGYRNSAIYLSLSISEGNSYSMLDALACGLPVLGTDVGLLGGDYNPRMGEVISFKDRMDFALIHQKLDHISKNMDKYDPAGWMEENCSFKSWKNQWRALIADVS